MRNRKPPDDIVGYLFGFLSGFFFLALIMTVVEYWRLICP